MLTRIWSLSVKEFIHLRNDWWLPAFMLLGGALELLLVGWATSRPITNLPTMVVDYDQTTSSRRLLSALENTGTFEIRPLAGEIDEVRAAMDRGQINVAVVIPPGFEAGLANPVGQVELPVLLNGAESIPATAALRAIEGITRSMGEQILLERLDLTRDQVAGFNPSLRVWYNESLSEALYTTPAELALMLEFTVLLFAALAFARERELGTLEQLLVMPYSSLELIIGKSIPVVIIGFADFLIMLSAVHVVFGVPIRGSLILLLLLATGYLLVELGKGLVISVMSRSQHQAFLLVLLVGMADFMFTGYAVPVESMPPLLQHLANLIPAHHWLTILRGIMLKDAGIDVLWPNLLALAALGFVIGSLSLRYVRKALD